MTATPRRISLITNSFFGLLSWLSPIAIGLIATPLIVKNVGTRDYGIYAAVLAFISYSFTFGIGKVLVKYVAEFRASGQEEKIGSAVSATFWFSFTIALLGTGIVAALARWIVSDVMYLPEDQRSMAATALYLACGAIITTMISRNFQSVLQGLHRFGLFLLLTNISGILLNAGNIGLAVAGYGIVTLLEWNLVALTVMAIVFAVYAVRSLPEFSISPRSALAMLGPVLRYGTNVMLYQIFGNILFVFESAFVVRKFGSEAATYYLIPMTLAIYLNGIIGSLLQATFPVVNELLDDRPRLIEVYQKSTKVVMAMIALAIVTVVCLGRSLLTVWIDAGLSSHSYDILVIHTLTFSIIAAMINPWGIAEGFRSAGLNTLVTVLWTLIAIPLMIVLANRWQLSGVALGRLLAVAITVPFILLIERRFLGGVFWRFWVSIGWRILGAVAACALVEVLVAINFPVNWLVLVCGVVVGTVVFGLMLLVTGFFTRDERALFSELIVRRA